MSAYAEFLERKVLTAKPRGLATIPKLASHLFPFQARCVEFGLGAASWGCFLSTGLGKTRIQLETMAHAAEASNGQALILTPLAVARQIEREGKSLGYDVRVIREQSDAGPGINVCNYDRHERLDVDTFGGVSLDESSVLKNWTGKTSRALRASFAGHRWRMAATATPAPNDHVELGTQSDFLGVLSQTEMLVRWFLNDSADTGEWRLKGHAVGDFWNWMASWSRMAEHPRDLGDDVPGYDLIPFRTTRHRAAESDVPIGGGLFGDEAVSATDMHRVKRLTAQARADVVAALVTADSEPWVIWCDTDYEADSILAALGDRSDVAEVRGSQTIERKEKILAGFDDGSVRVLISKPSLTGHGLNWQHCARMAFVGRSFSYELWYQAVRRCWRFGQKRSVEVHLVVAEGEDHIGRVIDRKAEAHVAMRAAMVAAMRRAINRDAEQRRAYVPTTKGRLPSWL